MQYYRKFNWMTNRPQHLYRDILILWLLTMVIFEYFTIKDGIIVTYQHNGWGLASILAFNQIFAAAFFYFGISNLILPIKYQKIQKQERDAELKILKRPFPKNWHPQVQLLYTTYNDFIPYAFHQCLQQTYQHVEGVILDNSTDQHYIDMIAQFIKVHPEVKWIRNVPNHGAKAGNLNKYLCHEGRNTYDYFVILDSDELLEPAFVQKCLKMFYYSKHLGVLQCNHRSGRNVNAFMRLFSKSGNQFWPVQNTIRSTNSGVKEPADGFHEVNPQLVKKGDTVCIELGHGCMFSKACFEDLGQMPIMVAEDLCSSIELLLKGWNIRFASQIYGNEEFPINMLALLVRSSKFCSANIQFFRVYAKRIIQTKILTMAQKLDVFTFAMASPIFAFQYLSLVICSIIMPLSHAQMGYQTFMLLPTLLCYFSQAIPDAIFAKKNGEKIWKIISFEFQMIILYGSFYYTTVKCIVLALIGHSAKFNVTPKENQHISLKFALKNSIGTIIFSLLTIVICIWISGNSWVLMSFLPGCFGFLMFFKSNKQNEHERKKQSRFNQYNNYALYNPTKGSIRWYE